jgi:RecB family exonuclease
VSGSKIAIVMPEGQPAQAAGVEFLQRAEVRDVLAWMRLLVDPQDAAAVVRALARPPIELRQVDLARVIQVARRRKLDLVVGLTAATESPTVPPEARERISRFVELHTAAAADLGNLAPDVFLLRLIERVAARPAGLLSPPDAEQQRASLHRLADLATEYVRGVPGATTGDLTRHLEAIVPDAGREMEAVQEPDDSPADALERTLIMLREEVLEGVTRIGGRLAELRLDTDLDISHGVVRYLELLKLSALIQRPEGQSLAEALSDINSRLLAAASPMQREILQTSTLDDAVLNVDCDERTRAQAIVPREERSLGPFLPRKGVGLALSASDIETYRGCPLRYKFARVLRIPSEQTVHQRFGIVVHQVLERYHGEKATSLEQMLALLDAGWRRSALGEGDYELQLLQRARAALTRYHARLGEEDSEPVWFERAFSFQLGPHHLRGRVDRVDRLGQGADAEYELIDYKTSRPKTVEALQDDVQLSLYALAAREAWQLDSSRQAYYYVLDDVKLPVPRSDRDAEAVTDIVLEVGEGILAQAFEPTPSRAACSICDYRIVCPAAEP